MGRAFHIFVILTTLCSIERTIHPPPELLADPFHAVPGMVFSTHEFTRYEVYRIHQMHEV